MNGQLSDAEIILASHGDHEQFAVIFQRHYRSIFRFVVGAVGLSDGEELAAEVFARAFTVRSRYDPAYPNALPWLYGIASNLVAGYHRDLARRARAHRRAGLRVVFAAEFEQDAVNRLMAASQRPLIAYALSQLRREEAEVVLLFSVSSLSYHEISEVLGIPEGTVRSRLSRARRRLQASALAKIGTVRDV